jgi:hypothetical protein
MLRQPDLPFLQQRTNSIKGVVGVGSTALKDATISPFEVCCQP